MPKTTWLIIDGNNLAHRAYHALRQLRNDKNIGTGIVFGFFRDIGYLMNRFNTDNVCFCFDDGVPLRRSIYPKYKCRDRNPDIERPIEDLKHQYLEEVGFHNIFFQEGYEGDDLVALACQSLRHSRRDEAILVSEDQDFYQCLSDKVHIYKPRAKKLYTEQDLWQEYELAPHNWCRVKAICGCTSDCVEGAFGVGEKTAAKFINGNLPKHHQTYKSIINNKEVTKRNLNLVTLPYPGLKPVPFALHQPVDSTVWKKFCKRMGMESLIKHPPILNQTTSERLF